MHRILLFSAGGRLYGCRIGVVREIIANRRTTRLPGAPVFVSGLINLRGSVVTVLDLDRRLGNDAGARADGSIILVDLEGKQTGIAVDEVMDVQPVPDDRIDAAAVDGIVSAVGREAEGRSSIGPAQGVVQGLGHLEDGRVVILLDVREMVRQVLRSREVR